MLKRVAAATAAVAMLATGTVAAHADVTAPPAGISQVGGRDAYQTAILNSQKTFKPNVDLVVMATGAGFTDGLAGAAVAANSMGPLLLSASDTLRADIAAELKRLNPGAVLISGGKGALSANVEAQIKAAVPGAVVVRDGGASIYDTAAAISADYYAGGAQTAFIVSGTSFADATTAVSPAGLTAGPLLLTGATLPTATKNELVRLKSKGKLENVIIVGGPGAVPAAVYDAVNQLMGNAADGYPITNRVWGKSLFDTSASMATLLWNTDGNPPPTGAYYVNYSRWPDALAAGPAAAANDQPVLHTQKACMPAAIKAWDTKNNATLASRVFVGGAGVLTATTKAC